MSWSVSLIGTSEKVVEALNKKSESLNGQSKIEYDSVLPSLVNIAQQNFGVDPCVIKLQASGHGTAVGDQQLERYFTVSLERLYGLLV